MSNRNQAVLDRVLAQFQTEFFAADSRFQRALRNGDVPSELFDLSAFVAAHFDEIVCFGDIKPLLKGLATFDSRTRLNLIKRDLTKALTSRLRQGNAGQTEIRRSNAIEGQMARLFQTN